jgi:hypothetical protein
MYFKNYFLNHGFGRYLHTVWYNNTLISKQHSSTKELNVVDIFNFIIILFRLRVMSESPDNEVRCRTEEREGGTRYKNDNNYEDANETIEEPRQDIHAHGEEDMRDNGGFHDDHRYKMSIKPEPFDGGEEYISHFEICAELGKWCETDKVLALAAALRGPAMTFYISLGQGEKLCSFNTKIRN